MQSEVLFYCCCIWQTARQELRVIAIHRGPRLRCSDNGRGSCRVEATNEHARVWWSAWQWQRNDDTWNCFARVFPASATTRSPTYAQDTFIKTLATFITSFMSTSTSRECRQVQRHFHCLYQRLDYAYLKFIAFATRQRQLGCLSS